MIQIIDDLPADRLSVKQVRCAGDGADDNEPRSKSPTVQRQLPVFGNGENAGASR